MPLVVRPGVVVPIPCRACSQACVKFHVQEGTYQLRCAKCGGDTHVRVLAEAGGWRVKTARVAVVPEPKRQ